MSCSSARGHRWIEPSMAIVRGMAIKSPETLRPDDRICRSCGARGKVDKQGCIKLVDAGTIKVQVVPLAARAKWAQKPTEHDQ